MKKQEYQKPAMQVVNISMSHQLLENSVQRVSGNAGLEYGGGSDEDAMSREGGSWDDED